MASTAHAVLSEPTGFPVARLAAAGSARLEVRLAAGVKRPFVGSAWNREGCSEHVSMWDSCWQERDTEVQGLQQRLMEAEEAHEEELADLQGTIQSCSAKLQDTKVLLQGL